MTDRTPTPAELELYERACGAARAGLRAVLRVPGRRRAAGRGRADVRGRERRERLHRAHDLRRAQRLRARRRRGRAALHGDRRLDARLGAHRLALRRLPPVPVRVRARTARRLSPRGRGRRRAALGAAARRVRTAGADRAQRVRRSRRAAERRQVDAHECALRRARRDRLGQAADDASACARRGARRRLPDRPRRPAGVPEALRCAHAPHAALGRRQPARRRCRAAGARCERVLGRRRSLHRRAARRPPALPS